LTPAGDTNWHASVSVLTVMPERSADPKLRVIGPSVGSGAFLGPVLERLLAARAEYARHRPWVTLRECIRGWDLQVEHVETSKRLRNLKAAGRSLVGQTRTK
jgi:hypothetical protein